MFWRNCLSHDSRCREKSGWSKYGWFSRNFSSWASLFLWASSLFTRTHWISKSLPMLLLSSWFICEWSPVAWLAILITCFTPPWGAGLGDCGWRFRKRLEADRKPLLVAAVTCLFPPGMAPREEISVGDSSAWDLWRFESLMRAVILDCFLTNFESLSTSEIVEFNSLTA